MLKKLILASALVAGTAFAQQNTDISGPNFLSGKADATLAALGRKAAASGNRLVITAPADWHAKIAAKVHAGGDADIVLKDGFYENVLVRIDDKAAETAKAEAAKAELAKADAEKKAARAETERKAREETAKQAAAAQAAALEQKPVPVPSGAPIAPMPVTPRPVVAAAPVAPPTAPAAARAPAAPAAAVVDVDAIHSRFEQSLNGGRSAEGSLPVAALTSGDALYVDGPVRAVVRREGLRPTLYWLDGNLDLRRAELKPLGPDRYQVIASIRGEGVLRREFSNAATVLDVREPATGGAARVALEKSLNDGHPITETLTPAKLHSGDVIYTRGDAAAVVRREGRDLYRFWLVGSLDLQQTGLQADGANKYKVLNDTVH
ncbi:MAG: hypothetical protein ACHP7D_07630 [Lysobacterales bacterium]